MSVPTLLADDPTALPKALHILATGGLVVVPTDTVYGIAAMASHDQAIARLYSLKNRPRTKALIALVDGPDMAQELASLTHMAQTLINQYWPGPLTLVLPKKPHGKLSNMARGGLPSIAVRCPDHAFTLNLIRTHGQPIVAPSANLAGGTAPVQISDICPKIAQGVDLIIDGGQCRSGQPSTLLDITGETAQILREGAIDKTALQRSGVRFD